MAAQGGFDYLRNNRVHPVSTRRDQTSSVPILSELSQQGGKLFTHCPGIENSRCLFPACFVQLERSLSSIVVPNANCFKYVEYEDFTVADFSGARGRGNRVSDFL